MGDRCARSTGPQLYVLGTLEIVSFSDDWLTEPMFLAADYLGSVVNDWGDRFDLWPGGFRFNSTETADCDTYIVDPWGGVFFAWHFLPPQNSVVWETFDLEFEVYQEICLVPHHWNLFTGTVFVDDEVVFEFADNFHGEYSVPISVEEHIPGAWIDVRIEIVGWADWTEVYNLSYLVNKIPVESTSFSSVKSMY